MSTADSEHPGVREQHLLRKRNNPLFPPELQEVSNEDLATARLQDGLEMDRFLGEFQTLVQRAVELEPNTPSETILEIKEQLDQAYQRACALPGDQSAVKQAIGKLVQLIMQAVRAGIGNDAYAERQLEEEDLARQAHYELQEVALVAALTHADSPIAENELIPSLLSEDDTSLVRCLFLFDAAQLAVICSDGERYLQSMDPEHHFEDAWRRLGFIRHAWVHLEPDAADKKAQ